MTADPENTGTPVLALLESYFAAWNTGGLEAAREFWTDDFEWDDLDAIPDGRVYRGHEEVIAHFAELEAVLGKMPVEIHALEPHGETVLVELSVSLEGDLSGVNIDGPIYEVVDVEDGRVRRIRLFTDRSRAVAAIRS